MRYFALSALFYVCEKGYRTVNIFPKRQLLFNLLIINAL